jgi:hypothetical protein
MKLTTDQILAALHDHGFDAWRRIGAAHQIVVRGVGEDEILPARMTEAALNEWLGY